MKVLKKIVIPAAGLGTRMLPATKSQPKEMLPVGRKPTIQYIVEEAVECGFKDILIITGRMKRSIEDHFDYDELLYEKLKEDKEYLRKEVEFPPKEVNIFFVRQSVQRGLADAILHAKDFVGNEHFAVSLGDSIIKTVKKYPLLYSVMENIHFSTSAISTIAVQKVERNEISNYGIIKPKDKANSEVIEMIDIHEKPKPENAFSNLAIAGRYIFNPKIFEVIERMQKKVEKGEIDFTECIKKLLEFGKGICVCLREGEVRYDIGNFESYFKAFFDMTISDKECGKKLKEYIKRKLK